MVMILMLIFSLMLTGGISCCSAQTSSQDYVLFDDATRGLSPQYIFAAITGAVNEVAEEKKRRHPDEDHPISILAAALNQTNKVINSQQQKTQQNTMYRASVAEQNFCTDEDIKTLLDALVTHIGSDLALNNIAANTRALNVYLLADAQAREEYLTSILNSEESRKAFVGELLFTAGNYIADGVYRTAGELAAYIQKMISSVDVSAQQRAIPITMIAAESPEIALLEALEKLGANSQRNVGVDEATFYIVDSLVMIAKTLGIILFSDINMLSFWQETTYVGALLRATDDFDLYQTIYTFITDQNSQDGFVKELVYCIYHVIFSRLGQILTLAYQTVQFAQATQEIAESSVATDIIDDYTDGCIPVGMWSDTPEDQEDDFFEDASDSYTDSADFAVIAN